MVEVTDETTLAATRRVGGDVAALVFASAKNSGGGFLGGAQAQEESIARSSALYLCLRTVPEYYAFRRDQRDLRYSDRVIYSPGVPVFRDDQGNLLDRPYRVAFLTAAAPNRGALASNQPGRCHPRTRRAAARNGRRPPAKSTSDVPGGAATSLDRYQCPS